MQQFLWFFFIKPFLAFFKNVNSNFASFSFPSLVPSDGTTAVLPSSELFAKTLSIPELFLLLQLPPTHLCLKFDFLLKMSFTLSLSLTLRRRMVKMVSFLWFSKLMLQSLHPSLVNYFVYFFLLQPSLFTGNVRSFNPLNPLTIVSNFFNLRYFQRFWIYP